MRPLVHPTKYGIPQLANDTLGSQALSWHLPLENLINEETRD